MVGIETVLILLKTHGIAILAPLAVMEGPIVTVIASYLASLAYLNVYVVFGVVVLADLVGDSILYGIGRRGPGLMSDRWRNRLGVTEERVAALTGHFRAKGGRTLVFGKFTHSAGVIVLIAAGAARMPFAQFLLFNLIATVPKSLLFVTIGYTLGHAYTLIDGWIFRASFTLMIVMVLGAVIWLRRKKNAAA